MKRAPRGTITPALRAIAVLIVSVITLGGGGAVAIWNGPGHAHPSQDRGAVQPWIFTVVSRSNGASGATYKIRIRLMADDAFVTTFGSDWKDDAQRVLARATPLLGQVSIGLDIVAIEEWHPTTSASLADMLAELVFSSSRPSDAVVIALTARNPSEIPHYDGWTSARAPAAIIKVWNPMRDEVGALITHEIGHVLGAGHHEGGHVCTEGGCLMDPIGFSHGYRWCEHHAETLASILSHL